MEEKDKDLKDALQKLEKCCPGSTRVSHMQTASAELHKALLKLDQARTREKRLREESDALLEGMDIIKNSESIQDAFKKVLEILKRIIEFDEAFVLRESTGGNLSSVVSSSPQFENIVWKPGPMVKHVLSGISSNIRNINYSGAWHEQPVEVRRDVKSALHIPFSTAMENAMLVCTSRKEDFFNKSHMQLLERFAPLVGQALYNLKMSERLNDEIARRKETEERLGEALTNIQNSRADNAIGAVVKGQ